MSETKPEDPVLESLLDEALDARALPGGMPDGLADRIADRSAPLVGRRSVLARIGPAQRAPIRAVAAVVLLAATIAIGLTAGYIVQTARNIHQVESGFAALDVEVSIDDLDRDLDVLAMMIDGFESDDWDPDASLDDDLQFESQINGATF
ncbi:MAG: hypothetical protein CMJ18_13550 [Phycisphaeraceae bacterium]|nr:hypothetical protein [Phycisphaeraceae bacterium]